MILRNESINSILLYQACLIPNLPEDLRHHVRDISNYIVVPLDTLLAVMSFICNTLVFITITRTKSLRHPSLLMLCSLSMSDLIWALFSLIKNSFVFVHPHKCPEHGVEKTCIGILGYLATLSNLAMISRDRYLAMSRPAWYRSHVSRLRARVVKTTLLAWLLSILTSLTVYTLFETFKTSSVQFVFIIIFLFYVVCISIILNNYVKCFMASRNHSRNMRRMQVGNIRAAVEKERKLTRIISVILLCFLFSVLPALMSPVVLVALRLPLNPFRPLNHLLLRLNGLLNPLLNYGKNEDVRWAMLTTLRCRRHRRIGQHVQQPAVRNRNRNALKENNNSVKTGERRLKELDIASK